MQGIKQLIPCFLIFWAGLFQTALGDSRWQVNDQFRFDNFKSIWGVSMEEIWAVGYPGGVYYFNGTEWTQIADELNVNLKDILGFSPKSIFTVGDKGVILHYDGSDWIVMDSQTKEDLRAIWGTGSNHLYALGRQSLHYFNGTDWKKMILDYKGSEPLEDFNDLWGINAHIYIAGNKGKIYRFDGTSLTSLTEGQNITEDLFAVWANEPNNVYAAGEEGTIVHFDGIFLEKTRCDTKYDFKAIWGTDNRQIFAAGDDRLLFFFDGSGWNPMKVPYDRHFRGIYGFPSNETLFAGKGGILHYNGGEMKELFNEESVSFTSVHGNFDGTVYASGNGGILLRFDGKNWERIDTPTKENINDLWLSDGGSLFAVGSNGTILLYRKSDWITMNAVPELLTDKLNYLTVWGTHDRNVYAAAEDGQVIHFDGIRWEKLEKLPLERPEAMWGRSGQEIYISGTSGHIYRGNGISWTNVESGLIRNLYSIWGDKSETVYMSGEGGALIQWNGKSWESIHTHTNQALYGITGSLSFPERLLAVGAEGTIVHNLEGTWKEEKTLYVNRESHFSDVWNRSETAMDIVIVGENGVIVRFNDEKSSPYSPLKSDAENGCFISALF